MFRFIITPPGGTKYQASQEADFSMTETIGFCHQTIGNHSPYLHSPLPPPPPLQPASHLPSSPNYLPTPGHPIPFPNQLLPLPYRVSSKNIFDHRRYSFLPASASRCLPTAILQRPSSSSRLPPATSTLRYLWRGASWFAAGPWTTLPLRRFGRA